MACVFCRIAGGEIPAEVIAREDGATAFLDVTPLADGHVLVIPNVHVGRVEDLEPEAAAALFRAVHRLVAEPARLRQPLAEPDDAAEGVDHHEVLVRGPRDQQAAVVGAEIDRRISLSRGLA